MLRSTATGPDADWQADEPALSKAVSRLRIRHFQLLDALDRLGSLRRAALELGVTQPAAVALIDDLEFAFGAALVVRGHSGTTLTPAAGAVLARSRVALHEVATARRLVACGKQRGGHLRLGASPYLISTMMPDLLARLRGVLPDIQADVREGTLDALVAELDRGELDAVLASVDHAAVLSSGASLDITSLASERMCVVAGRGHALYGAGRASLDQVLRGPWVLPHAISHLRALVDSAVFEVGAAPIVPRVECRGVSNLLLIAAASGLLTVAPRYEASRPHWRGSISLLDDILPFNATPYVLVTRRYATWTAELQALREEARAVAGQLFGTGLPA
jgi:DNA-binding transcriptional LysR family regulator